MFIPAVKLEVGDRKGIQKFWQFINSSVHLHEELYCGFFPQSMMVPNIYTGVAAVGSSPTPGQGAAGRRISLWETSAIELQFMFSFQSLNPRILVKCTG